jgi:predicted amidohydrolase YtcJ
MRTLYRASRVYTLAHPTVATWVLVDGRHVERVGTSEPPDADRTVELPGATIVPGFVDAHVHLTGTGIHHRAPEVASARDRAELLRLLRVAAERRTGPLLVHGFDESRWLDRSIPSVDELDEITTEPLAAVRIDGHLTVANTSALRASAILDRAGLERDERGSPTGRVTGDANVALRRWFASHLDPREIEDLQLAAAGLAVSLGVTTIHEMSMPHERGLRDLEILLGHRRRLPLDVVTYVATTDIPQVIDLGLPAIGGDLPVDGSIGARTAAVSEPYVDGSGSGSIRLEDDELATFFHDAHLAGLQVGVHAIGDSAIERVIGTWERVYRALDSRGRRHLRARRHRIEHFEMATTTQVERAAMLGLAISVQPSFDAAWGGPGGLYEQALGMERARGMNAFRALLERGLEIGAGSDAPVTTIDPLAAVAAMQAHHAPGERLSRPEAVRLLTLGSARLAHQEDKKGSLEPGKHADLVVYDVDPLEVDALDGVRPVLTVSLGRDVFAS